jgi:hypothetical protein
VSAVELALGIMLALLAVIAWAAAYRTLLWLGEAEDVIEQTRQWLGNVDAPDSLIQGLAAYQRRTPRRTR